MSRFTVIAILVSLTPALAADPALTIYNQNFAVVRETVPLELKAGVNTVRFAGATAQVEPDSVVLRDPTARTPFSVLEQSYRNDPATESSLLKLFEGKTIGFHSREPNKPDRVVQGKIIRGGTPPAEQPFLPGRAEPQNPVGPVIEVDGQLQFSLPGEPHFPALGDDTILQPTLSWQIQSEGDARLDAELSYVTGGLSWEASYNLLAPEKGDVVDLIGWITVKNQSGKIFTRAHVKLIAGDVNKLANGDWLRGGMATDASPAPGRMAAVTERAFDDLHLYTLPQPTTIHDAETKQLEFVRAQGVKATRLYIYDGAAEKGHLPSNVNGILPTEPSYGIWSNTKVWIVNEFRNSAANNLGLPLPKGRIRFYRQDGEQLQFTGEDLIDHTARDETLRLYTGNAFDLIGERRQTNFRSIGANQIVEESFEIKLRNRKTEPAEIRVIEHLYRGNSWTVKRSSLPFVKIDARTIEFRSTLAPDEERVLTYDVEYIR